MLLQRHEDGLPPAAGRPASGGSDGSKALPGSKPGSSHSQRSNSSAYSSQHVAAEYVLDFGYVVKGTNKVTTACDVSRSCCICPGQGNMEVAQHMSSFNDAESDSCQTESMVHLISYPCTGHLWPGF